MSLEDLRRAGVLLPEDEWGERSLETTAHVPALAAIGIAAVASIAMMYVGAGRALTWIGTGLYLVSLAAFTWISLRAVDAQVERGEGAGRDSAGGKGDEPAR